MIVEKRLPDPKNAAPPHTFTQHSDTPHGRTPEVANNNYHSVDTSNDSVYTGESSIGFTVHPHSEDFEHHLSPGNYSKPILPSERPQMVHPATPRTSYQPMPSSRSNQFDSEGHFCSPDRMYAPPVQPNISPLPPHVGQEKRQSDPVLLKERHSRELPDTNSAERR